jgi:hypothetical protein
VSRLRRLAAPAAALAALLAGCSTVPSSSPTIQITQVAQPNGGAVGIEPLAPESGATPEEVVRGFIDASATTRSPGSTSPTTSRTAGPTATE